MKRPATKWNEVCRQQRVWAETAVRHGTSRTERNPYGHCKMLKKPFLRAKKLSVSAMTLFLGTFFIACCRQIPLILLKGLDKRPTSDHRSSPLTPKAKSYGPASFFTTPPSSGNGRSRLGAFSFICRLHIPPLCRLSTFIAVRNSTLPINRYRENLRRFCVSSKFSSRAINHTNRPPTVVHSTPPHGTMCIAIRHTPSPASQLLIRPLPPPPFTPVPTPPPARRRWFWCPSHVDFLGCLIGHW